MRFLIYNGPMQTNAAPAKVSLTGGVLKTLMQIAPLVSCKLVEWGISFDGYAAAMPGTVEIIETDISATLTTAYVSNDFTKVTHPQDTTVISTLFTLSTSGSGYTASAEGTVISLRNLDAPQLIAPTTEFIKQVPLGGEAILQAGKYSRIRAGFAGTVSALCYMIVEV